MTRKELEKLVSVESGWQKFDLIDVYDNVWKTTKYHCRYHYRQPNWFHLNQHSQLFLIKDNNILIRMYGDEYFNNVFVILQKKYRYSYD